MIKKRFNILFYLLLTATHVNAESLDDILALEESPTGVVIEIIKADGEALYEHLVKIRAVSDTIRRKFPNLPIAVVSHGYEQFALTSRNAVKYSALHDDVKNLVENE